MGLLMKKRCLLNVANGHAYPRGQHRLVESLIARYDGAVKTWAHQYPKNSPTHDECPYAFKLHAIEEAAVAGFTTILWVDAAVWAVKPLEDLLLRVEREGHFFFHGGASLGQRCSDECLLKMGFRPGASLAEAREEAFKVPLIGGTVYGLDLTHARTREFYNLWWKGYRDGCFFGAAINDVAKDNMSGLAGRPVGHVSDDPRVQGHCHDESVATIAAHLLGMQSVGIGDVFAPYSPQNAADPRVYLVSQGL